MLVATWLVTVISHSAVWPCLKLPVWLFATDSDVLRPGAIDRLRPLAGYLRLGARLAAADGAGFTEGWNFGPDPEDTMPVRALAEAMLANWGRTGWVDASDHAAPREAAVLRLAITKAAERLGWRPVWNFAETIARTADWYRRVAAGEISARAACEADIAAFCAAGARHAAVAA